MTTDATDTRRREDQSRSQPDCPTVRRRPIVRNWIIRRQGLGGRPADASACRGQLARRDIEPTALVPPRSCPPAIWLAVRVPPWSSTAWSRVVCCHAVATVRLAGMPAPFATDANPPISSYFQCARVDSNHHGEISPQGPQPRASSQDKSDGSQNVQIVRFFGRIGRIGRSDCCHDVATLTPASWAQLPAPFGAFAFV
jgi:hypothetical protein